MIAEDNTIRLYDKPNTSYVWFIAYHAWAAEVNGTAQPMLSFAPTNFPTIRAKGNILKSEAGANSDKVSALRLSNGTTTTIVLGQIDLGFDTLALQTAVDTDFTGFDTTGALLRLENTRFAGTGYEGVLEVDALSTCNAPLATVRRVFSHLQAMQCGLATVTFTADDTRTATADVVFPTPFRDTGYSILLTVKSGDGRYRVFTGYENKLKSGFRIFAIADNNEAFTADRTLEISWFCVAENA